MNPQWYIKFIQTNPQGVAKIPDKVKVGFVSKLKDIKKIMRVLGNMIGDPQLYPNEIRTWAGATPGLG
jgi:hypothetical protein